MLLTQEKLLWVKSPYAKVRGDFSRAAFATSIDVRHLEEIYGDAKIRPMNDMVWRRLQNSESWKIRKPEDVKVDLSAMIDTFNTGRVTAPIILNSARDRYWLVAGEQQLLVSRVSGIIPKVVFVRTYR
jgi:hypothetical protein